MGEKWQNLPFLGRTRTSVQVSKVGTGNNSAEGLGTGTKRRGTDTEASSNPIFVPLHC